MDHQLFHTGSYDNHKIDFNWHWHTVMELYSEMFIKIELYIKIDIAIF
jgi:hypothetical protein